MGAGTGSGEFYIDARDPKSKSFQAGILFNQREILSAMVDVITKCIISLNDFMEVVPEGVHPKIKKAHKHAKELSDSLETISFDLFEDFNKKKEKIIEFIEDKVE